MSARLIALLLVSALSVVLTACGSEGSPSKPAPGTPDNPLVAKPSTADVTTTGETGDEPGKPGYAKLVERQREAPVRRNRDTPCSLVTKRQAQTILGAKLLDPVVVPQGPTLPLPRSRESELRDDRDRVDGLQRRCAGSCAGATRRCVRSHRVLRHARPADALPPLSRGRVLSVASHCDSAARLARRASARLRP